MQQTWKQLNQPEAAPPWGLITAIVAVVIAFVFLTLVGGTIGLTLLADTPSALPAGWLAGSLLTLAFVLITRRTPEDRRALFQPGKGMPLLIAFGIGFGIAVTLDLIAAIFVQQVIRAPELATLTSGLALWGIGGVFMIIVQPLNEELIFRGMLYPALRAAQGWVVAVVVSSAFYGLFHQLIYSSPLYAGTLGLWYTLIEPLLAGLVFGLIRAASKSTWAAVAAHVGFGVFAFLKSLFISGALVQ